MCVGSSQNIFCCDRSGYCFSKDPNSELVRNDYGNILANCTAHDVMLTLIPLLRVLHNISIFS